MTPTPERFRRLARSSPYRWDALAFDVAWPDRAVRALVRRPDLLRVEDGRGRLLQAGRQAVGPLMAPLTSDGSGVPYLRPRPPAVLDEDGLHTVPRVPWNEPDGVPMWQDYRWVAMLDPAELVDGTDGEHGTELLELRPVDHHGRPAWEALLRPTDAYEPRCSCCPLLWSPQSAAAEAAAGLPVPEGATYADAHLVRLDVETGVCVLTREVGGPRDGQGHDLRITEVDGAHDPALFR